MTNEPLTDSSLAARAVWCVICGQPPDYAISSERHGVIAHHGACRAHLMAVAARVLSDRDAVEYERLRRQADTEHGQLVAVEVDETTTYELEP